MPSRAAASDELVHHVLSVDTLTHHFDGMGFTGKFIAVGRLHEECKRAHSDSASLPGIEARETDPLRMLLRLRGHNEKNYGASMAPR
jgi:hypothetical protein